MLRHTHMCCAVMACSTDGTLLIDGAPCDSGAACLAFVCPTGTVCSHPQRHAHTCFLLEL